MCTCRDVQVAVENMKKTYERFVLSSVNIRLNTCLDTLIHTHELYTNVNYTRFKHARCGPFISRDHKKTKRALNTVSFLLKGVD